jgi:KUP system potassium uptake protein
VPRVNGTLPAVVILLVLGFQTSDSLGAAYGIAVTGMMVITSGLAFIYMRSIGWSLPLAGGLFGFFLLVDLTFLSANLLKIVQGGWFPILVALIVFTVMSTWWRGRRILAERRSRDSIPLETFIDGVRPDHPPRIPGTAIVMTRELGHVPTALLHLIKHFKVLHERTVLMTLETRDVPHVTDDERLEIHDLGKGFYAIHVWYGFLDEPNLPRALAQCRLQQLRLNLIETSFIIGREKLVPSRRNSQFSRWRKQLFIVMTNNALDATEFFRIPPNRVVELGGQVEI